MSRLIVEESRIHPGARDKVSNSHREIVEECLRVESVDDVVAVSKALRHAGIDATEAHLHPGYAPDYWATFFTDPDGVRLEVTNYRAERRERHDKWDELKG